MGKYQLSVQKFQETYSKGFSWRPYIKNAGLKIRHMGKFRSYDRINFDS
jgi:hypothetical protein